MELIFLPSLSLPFRFHLWFRRCLCRAWLIRRSATSDKQMKPAETAKASEWNQRTRCGRASERATSERIAIKTIKLHLLSVYSIIFCDRFAIRNFIFISPDALCSAAIARAARLAQHFLSCLVGGRKATSQRKQRKRGEEQMTN